MTPKERSELRQYEQDMQRLGSLIDKIRLLKKQRKNPKKHLARLQKLSGLSEGIVKGYCDKIEERDRKSKTKASPKLTFSVSI